MKIPILKQMPLNEMFLPKGPVVDQMCERCPFKPDGSGYAVDHPDFPNIVTSVALGLPFLCHNTTLNDSRTEFKNGDLADTNQEHIKLCKGAVLYKQGKLALSEKGFEACQQKSLSDVKVGDKLVLYRAANPHLKQKESKKIVTVSKKTKTRIYIGTTSYGHTGKTKYSAFTLRRPLPGEIK